MFKKGQSGWKGHKWDKRHKEFFSRNKKQYFKNPRARKSISRKMVLYLKNNPKIMQERIKNMHTGLTKEIIESRTAKIRRAYKKRRLRNKIKRIKLKQYRTNPELRKKIDKVVTEWWRDNPSARKSLSKKIKWFFIKNPKAFEEFLKHGKNPLKSHIKTLQGFLVRSLGEKLIANFLHAHCIPCLYESISLMITKKPFKGNICTPDFYIPEWNIFVEFYGGYPKAWKKKVLKNKIYSKHKIPVLAITPAELENLGYFLLKQGKQLSNSDAARKFDVKKWIR